MDAIPDSAELFQPTVADFKRALLAVRDSNTSDTTWKTWTTLLQAQVQKPEHKITATGLAEAAKLNGYSEANLRYGNLAHAVAQQLRYTPPNRPRGDKRPMWWMTLSTGEVRDDKDQFFEFTMHAALADALREMRWA